MKSTLRQLAAEVREVWNPPGTRAWSIADVRIVKLLKAVEDAPDESLQHRVSLERLFIAIASDFDQYTLGKVRERIEELCR